MLLTLLPSNGLWSLAFINWYRFPSIYSIQICNFFVVGSRKISRAGTRWWCWGRDLRKMTSRSSRHGWNDSNFFFMVLIATCWQEHVFISLLWVINYEIERTDQCSPSGNMTPSTSYFRQHNVTKTSISDVLYHLKPVRQSHCSRGGHVETPRRLN